MPVTAALAGSNYNGSEMLDYIRNKVEKVIVIDTEKACKELGSAKIVNLLLLGAAVNSGALGLDDEDIRKVIRTRIPEKFHELNFKALEYAKKCSH